MKERIIEYLRIELRPFTYNSDNKQKELQVGVQVNSKQYQYTKVLLPEDDILSLFDTLFEYARREIRTTILSATDPVSSTQEKPAESSSEKSSESGSH